MNKPALSTLSAVALVAAATLPIIGAPPPPPDTEARVGISLTDDVLALNITTPLGPIAKLEIPLSGESGRTTELSLAMEALGSVIAILVNEEVADAAVHGFAASLEQQARQRVLASS